MLTRKPIIACLLLLLGVGFFGFSSAQQTTNDILTGTINDILTGTIPAPVEISYHIDASKINDFLSSSSGFQDFYQKIRIDMIKFLIENGYSGFDNRPYQEGNYAIVEQSGDFKVMKNIEQSDTLDILLQDELSGVKNDFENIKNYGAPLDYKNIEIISGAYAHLGPVFMFKDEKDLRDLGYELISWKEKINTDPDYRRQNIRIAFHNIGNVRLIMPGETFSVYHEFGTPYGGEIFRYGHVIVGGGLQMLYGGGLCGVTTAFYQGTLTNLGFEMVQHKPHSIYYKSLYSAEINGQYISTPGLDSAVYLGKLDVKIKNIRDYPIIVVANFDGIDGHKEQMFTLSKPQDKGFFAYVGSPKKRCYTWNINGVDRTSCYNSVQ